VGAMDFQLGVADESVYGTLVTPTRFFEFNSETIGAGETYGRTEGDPLRAGGQGVIRHDRFTPYFSGAAGTVGMDVLTKGFGWWLRHMLGAVATTQPDAVGNPAVYVHTGTLGEMFGDSYTLQVNRPFNPSGTNQPFTYSGGKVASWTISNSVDANLVLEVETDFQKVDTAAALAAASYPAGMEPLTWAGGVITIGGADYDVTEFSVSCNNGLDVDRRQIRANTLKKEPPTGRREIEWSLSADFDSLAQRNRAYADTRDGALATISASWTAPTLISGTYYPKLTVSIPAGRFDAWEGAVGGYEAISQTLSGVGRWNGTDSAVSVAYQTTDATP
jgi:hypothetical protein